MNRQKLQKWHILAMAALYTCVSSLLITSSAFAHDAPPGDEYQMADWMLFSFLIFFGASFIVFLFALKRGMLSQPEDAKYYVLTIDEEDYYTPAWAKKNQAKEPEEPNGLQNNFEIDGGIE